MRSKGALDRDEARKNCRVSSLAELLNSRTAVHVAFFSIHTLAV